MSGHANLIPVNRVNRDWRKPRNIGYKTTAWNDSEGFAIRLHHTCVVSYCKISLTVRINTGGWHSGITAQRINHGLREIGLQLLTRDLPNRWRVADYKGNAFTIRGNNLVLRYNHKVCEWERVNS